MSKAFRTVSVVLLVVSCMTGTGLYGQEDIDRYIERGINFEREGNLEEAVESYEEVISHDPENVMIRIRLAKILSWQNEFDRALELLEEVLEQMPDNKEALFRKAQITSWKGRYEESIVLYRRFLELKPDDSNGFLGLARVLFWSGRYDEAIQHFEKALSSGADEVEVRIEIGKVYLALHDRKKAKEEFETVLAMDPGNYEAERFLKGIRLEKTYELSPVNTRINIYPDSSVGVAFWSEFMYHPKNRWDLVFGFEHATLHDMRDTSIYFIGVYRGVTDLYLRGGLELTPAPSFSPWLKTDLGVSYTFGTILGAGLSFTSDIYEEETLFAIIPEIRKDFSDLTWVGLKYYYYFYTTGYSAGRIELVLNLEYMENNDLFVKAVYGGDVETRDPARRVFDFATGISVSLTDQIETSLSFAWVETLYGRSSEISWSSYIRW